MEIICGCGNKDMIVGKGDFYDDSEHADLEEYGFDTRAEHDEFWITCRHCGKSYHLFT